MQLSSHFWVQYTQGCLFLEDTVNVLHASHQPNRTALAAKAVLACVTLLCAASAFSQAGAMSPYQDEKDGVSAGGKWMEFQSEDKMTGAKGSWKETVAGIQNAVQSQIYVSSASGLECCGSSAMFQRLSIWAQGFSLFRF